MFKRIFQYRHQRLCLKKKRETGKGGEKDQSRSPEDLIAGPCRQKKRGGGDIRSPHRGRRMRERGTMKRGEIECPGERGKALCGDAE